MDGLAIDDVGLWEQVSLFRWALLAAFACGLVLPLVGVQLLLRKTSFQAIALPQFASVGMIAGYIALPWWIDTFGLGGLSVEQALNDPHAGTNWHLAWAAGAVFLGSWLLFLAARRGPAGLEPVRVAAAFALASALSYILGRLSPVGRGHVDDLLAGELLGVGVHEFETIGVGLLVVLLSFLWTRNDLLACAFDPEGARVLGKRVQRWELLHQGLVGLSVSLSTLVVGPVLTFGLLVLPALAARPWARSMRAYWMLASGAGVAAVAAGSLASLGFDLPLGPAITAAAALLLAPRGWRKLD
ncbi:MAG: High-affinity zinc uptake system rane protein ZnuB [Planctomycetota bacterium]|jgi:ABC-type Mn2+/Zn2+ transport system permease subunit